MSEENISRFKMTIIRHGETYENKQNILQGQKDTLLSNVGKEQAQLTGQFLKSTQFDFIYTSDLLRTVETLDEILSQLKPPTLAVVKKDPRLRERCFGILEGRKRSDCVSINSSSNSKDYICPEGAENLEEVRDRAVAFFEDLCHFIHNQHASSSPPPPSKSRSLVAPPNMSLPPHCHISSNSSKPHCCAQSCNMLPVTSSSLPISGLYSGSGSQRFQQSISCSSISSGRNSYEEGAVMSDLPSAKPDHPSFPSSHSFSSYFTPHVLLVSHGGLIRELFRYFIDSCHCPSFTIPKPIVVDNCSISEFIVELSTNHTSSLNIHVDCSQFNLVQHLNSMKLR